MKSTLLVIAWLVVAVVAAPKMYPLVTGATVSSVDVTSQLSIVDYEPASSNRQDITKAIIVIHGKNRDAWKYYRALQTAVKTANVQESSIYILAPEFLTRLDIDLARPNSLIWSG
jgi:hypothetical protein